MGTVVINILPGGKHGEPAVFVPTLEDPGPNGEAFASRRDLVSWFNGTSEAHQLEATDDTFSTPVNAPRGSPYYLADRLSAGKPSRPGWIAVPPVSPPFPAASNTLCYRCRLHPNEHGRIIIS